VKADASITLGCTAAHPAKSIQTLLYATLHRRVLALDVPLYGPAAIVRVDQDRVAPGIGLETP
jgi:hypothetical protein